MRGPLPSHILVDPYLSPQVCPYQACLEVKIAFRNCAMAVHRLYRCALCWLLWWSNALSKIVPWLITGCINAPLVGCTGGQMLPQKLRHVAQPLPAIVGASPASDPCSYRSEPEPQNQHAGSSKAPGPNQAACSAPLWSVCSPAKCAVCGHDISFGALHYDVVLGLGTIRAAGRRELHDIRLTLHIGKKEACPYFQAVRHSRLHIHGW